VPENITVNNDLNSCGAVVTYAVSASDNCSEVTPEMTAGLAPVAELPAGTTTVTYATEDEAGNEGTASFTVTVNDNQAPVVTVPENITVNNDLNSCGAVVTYAVSASHNCSGVTPEMTAGLASGAEFPVGTTTVTYADRKSVG